MNNKLQICFTVLCLLIFVLPNSQADKNEDQYKALFKKAEDIFTGASDEHNDSIALSYYSEVIRNVPPSASNALLLYNCHERAGILQQGLGFSNDEILTHFYTALAYQQQFHLPDSILFRLLLSTGNEHYSNGLFDSSLLYFSKAESIIERYPHAGLAGDLYNSLGALYSESGDYKQSSVYFNKALEITRQTRPELGEGIFAMSLNIASALKLSGYRDTAIGLYKKLLNPGNPSTPVLNNLAGIYLLKKIPDSALYYLGQIKTPEGSFAISFNNSNALAWLQKNHLEKAGFFLDKADSVYHKNFDGTRNAPYSLTNKLRGDMLVQQLRPNDALNYYQASIIQADYKFNDKNVFTNPGNFTGDFASYGLFEALLAKANCFALLYNNDKENEIFKAAVNTFDTAFALADYIKKSIDNDEARLFIADKVFNGYQKATGFILNSASPEGNDSLMHKALMWISKSRSTSLAISLKENSIKQFAGLPDSLLQKEKNIKINLSRLKLYMQQSADSAAIAAYVSQINSKELELHDLQNSYRKFPAYYAQKFASDSFDLKTLQRNIPDNNTAVVSYFMGEKTLMCFVIKRSGLEYFQQAADAALYNAINTFSAGLSSFSSDQQNDLAKASAYLYNKLIQPVNTSIKGIHSLIIIPDQQLINLPFEALQAADGKYLIENFAITYQYALPFLHVDKLKADLKKVLAIAPFASGKTNNFEQLKSSSDEIAGFAQQDQLLNAAATKNNFIAKAPSASVIHLATHAVVDFSNPAESFIAFYPVSKADSSYKIFAHELYNFQLPDARLVFLSACETGTGRISQSEGALSLSRAFAYAGCENIVTSLWKAEDKSTAYISNRFYDYLRKGYTYADALQQAKIDLLKDGSMSQFHAPQYWSHLVFIGNMQQQNTSIFTWMAIAAVCLMIALMARTFFKKSKITA